MHSVIMLEGHDQPLAPAITRADQHTEACAQALRAQVDSISLYQRTGCPLQPIYHPAKVRWCVDMTGKRFARIVSIKEYILHPQARVWCYVQDASHWLAGGAINNGGLAAQWAKEKFYPHDDFETMFEEVEMMAEYTSFGTYPLPTTSSYSCSPPSSKT